MPQAAGSLVAEVGLDGEGEERIYHARHKFVVPAKKLTPGSSSSSSLFGSSGSGGGGTSRLGTSSGRFSTLLISSLNPGRVNCMRCSPSSELLCLSLA